MDLNHYQMLARETAQYPCIGNMIVYPALGMAGEAGEVADKVKKLFRDHSGELTEDIRLELAKEIGDVLWYVANFAHELGYSLDQIAGINIDKLRKRKAEGKLCGNGDNR